MSKNDSSFQTIGSNLRSLRQEAGLTLKQVATAVNLDVSLLSKLERDIRLPTEPQCAALAGFFGVSPIALQKERLLTRLYDEIGEENEFDNLADQVREPGVAYLDNRTAGLMGLLDYRRLDVSRQIAPDRKSKFGQFFTPANIAEFMSDMFGNISEPAVKILDPGAGMGVLSAALVNRILQQPDLPKSIAITAFEIDPFIRSQLDVTLNICRRHCKEAGVDFSADIISEDFIQYTRHQFENSLFGSEPAMYTHAILNPPYKKIGSGSEQRIALSSLGIETGNLYSAFTALALKWLDNSGELVAITPRSFCNGSYFKPFRRYLFDHAALRQIHVFEYRNKAFSDEDVLQENIIFHLVKGQTSDRVIISSSSGSGWDVLTKRNADISQVAEIKSGEKIIHIASNDFDQDLVDQMQTFPCLLNDFGINVSTGRVVDFRSKEFLRERSNEKTVPLIYPGHMKNGTVEHPQKSFEKNQFIEACAETMSLFFPAGIYVVVKRFSAKEEPRRIVASFCITETEAAFENHVNVYHTNGEGLPTHFAKGLTLFLNSSLVDMYFRLFSGHTQVNAGDLQRLNYPKAEILEKWGAVYERIASDQEMIDDLVEAEANKMTVRKKPGKRIIRRKLKEALQILQDLGLPKEQQNERSALTLLALAGLVSDAEWTRTNSPLIGITPIMDFCRENYGVRYAPNTRETFRRQTMHQFVQAGLAIENPDDPARPTNSPKWCYQLSAEAAELLKKYGTEDWNSFVSEYLAKVPALQERYASLRELEKIPVSFGDGKAVKLSSGDHNRLIKAIIEQFCPRFTPGTDILYVGDTKEKFAFCNTERLKKLGCAVNEHGKMPDVIAFYPEKKWLILVESVTSHGPVDSKRHAELADLFSTVKPGIVYVTAFPNRTVMARYLGVISWETEVWIADAPDHLIHFNGERFLGPYETSRA